MGTRTTAILSQFRAYRRILSMHLMHDATYRGRMFVYAVVSFLYLGIFLAIWLSISEGGDVGGFSQGRLVTYFLGVYVIGQLVFAYGLVEAGGHIRRGEISQHLVRPLRYVRFLGVGERASNITQVLLSTPFIAILLVTWWDQLVAPSSWGSIGLAMLALAGGMILAQSLAHCIGFVAFWLEDTKGFIALYFVADSLLSGYAIPLALMPEWMATIAQYSPFRYFASFPMELYFGSLSAQGIVQGFAMLVVWGILLHLLSRLLWRRGIRRYTAVGM